MQMLGGASDSVPTVSVPGTLRPRALTLTAVNGGSLSGEFLSLAAGTDIAPLLESLPGDACQARHWGYMIEGGVVVTYEDGTTETCRASDVFYWPPGHSVRVTDDAEVIMFSPQIEHTTVLDHMLAKMTAV